MKILHVVNRGYGENTGGGVIKKRNTRILEQSFGKESVLFFEMTSKKNKLLTLIKILCGYYGGNSYINERKIEKIIIKENINIVFLDSSLFGKTGKFLKKKFPSLKIVTFFHNIEFDFFISEYKTTKKLKVLMFILLSYFNEKLAIKYSDEIFVLNQRDEQRLKKVYKLLKQKINLLPISLENNNVDTKKDEIKFNGKFGLFVGSYFYPNIEGIEWFAKNVAEHILVPILVVGKDMEKLKKIEEKYKNIKIIGTVPELDSYYKNAEFIIAPIFSGAGMKVKTAEALKYGKTIFGTKEAFEGYELEFNKIGGLCDTSEEYISKINKFLDKENSKINEYSKKIFEENYTDEVMIKKVKNILKVKGDQL